MNKSFNQVVRRSNRRWLTKNPRSQERGFLLFPYFLFPFHYKICCAGLSKGMDNKEEGGNLHIDLKFSRQIAKIYGFWRFFVSETIEKNDKSSENILYSHLQNLIKYDILEKDLWKRDG